MADEAATLSPTEAAQAAIEAMGLDDGDWPDPNVQATLDMLPEADGDEEDTDPAEPEAEEAVDGPAEDEEEDEEVTESEPLSEDDVPTEYFGVDLSDFPPEKRAEIIAGFKERDLEIQQVKRENAQLRKGEAEPEAEAEDTSVEYSDEDLMVALGYDPEDPMYDVKAEVALPLAKQLMEVTTAVTQLVEERQLEAFGQAWSSALDEAEEAYGKLPISRDEFLDYAIENRIPDPVDAYARFMMTGRKQVETAVNAAREEAQKLARQRKKEATTPRRGSDSTKDKAPAKLLSPEEAAQLAAKTMKGDWSAALKNAR